MKLLLCEKCWDVFKLGMKMRECSCGKVYGRYVNNTDAEVSENAISLAIGNGALEIAISHMMETYRESKGGADREEYYKTGKGKIEYAWVRPNSGNGNPHCKII